MNEVDSEASISKNNKITNCKIQLQLCKRFKTQWKLQNTDKCDWRTNFSNHSFNRSCSNYNVLKSVENGQKSVTDRQLKFVGPCSTPLRYVQRDK